MEKRNQYADYLRGICVFLVILGHSIQYGNGFKFLDEGGYWLNPLMVVIYSFHMPLFMAISGYFFYGSLAKKGSLKVCLVRAKQVLPPIIVMSSVSILIHHFFYMEKYSLKRIASTYLTSFWFLWSVLFASIVIAIVERTKIEFHVPVYALIAIAFFLSPDVLWMNAHKFMFPYYLAGFLIAKRKNKYQFKWWQAGLALAVWALSLLFWDETSYIYTTGFTLIRHQENFLWQQQLAVDLYRYFVGLCGCIMTVSVSWCAMPWINKASGVWKCLLEFGKNSMGIYILSSYFFSFLLPVFTQGYSFSYFRTFLVALVLVFICDGATRLIGQSKPLKAILI